MLIFCYFVSHLLYASVMEKLDAKINKLTIFKSAVRESEEPVEQENDSGASSFY
jgi:hypothetical protein